MTSRIACGNWEIPPVQVVALSKHDGQACGTEVSTCPVCGCDYVHLVGAGVQDDKQLILHSGDGWHVISAPLGGWDSMSAHAPRRGSAVVVIYLCENDHCFCERRQFHKGQTFVTYRAFQRVTAEELKTLWRT
jgi:hypothetical protein